MKRSEAVPYTIRAVVVILFNRVLEEDIQYMKDGLSKGNLIKRIRRLDQTQKEDFREEQLDLADRFNFERYTKYMLPLSVEKSIRESFTNY